MARPMRSSAKREKNPDMNKPTPVIHCLSHPTTQNRSFAFVSGILVRIELQPREQDHRHGRRAGLFHQLQAHRERP
jgi:hypothetical protein